jgi:acetolactate synthase-1/2/3 large subunit
LNGSDVICETLIASGVEVCFANPGTSELHLVAGMERRADLRCVLGLFEGVVTGAADGYGRMTDKPAATLLHLGPGLGNGLANLHNARRARTPIVNIVGDHATHHLPFNAPLTSDIESLARPMSNWYGRIGSVHDIASSVSDACRAARSLPGVATLVVPAEVTWGDADPVQPPSLTRFADSPPPPDREKEQRAVALLRSNRKTALFLGGRALRQETLALASEIARKTGASLMAPFANARMARGAGRPAVPRVAYATDLAVAQLAQFDAIVMIGAERPVAFFAHPGMPSRLLRDDCEVIELCEPGGDVAAAIEGLAEYFASARLVLDEPPPARRRDQPHLPLGPLTNEALAELIARLLPDNAIVCDEALSSVTQLFAKSYDAAPHDWLQITGGSIGIGIPLATGAAIACPDRKVITLQADGSGMYTLQGLWTQAHENLDAITIVLANRKYALLIDEMRRMGVKPPEHQTRGSFDLTDPILDWVSLAKGMGVEAARASTAEEFIKVFVGALKRRGPFLIEAVLS